MTSAAMLDIPPPFERLKGLIGSKFYLGRWALMLDELPPVNRITRAIANLKAHVAGDRNDTERPHEDDEFCRNSVFAELETCSQLERLFCSEAEWTGRVEYQGPVDLIIEDMLIDVKIGTGTSVTFMNSEHAAVMTDPEFRDVIHMRYAFDAVERSITLTHVYKAYEQEWRVSHFSKPGQPAHRRTFFCYLNKLK